MKSHGVEISIPGCVEDMARDPKPMTLLFFFHFFFFYHVFIVFRYKKVRAAVAIERTKPMDQNKVTKATLSVFRRGDRKYFRLKQFAYGSSWKQNIRKLECTNYIPFAPFLQGRIYVRKVKTTNCL